MFHPFRDAVALAELQILPVLRSAQVVGRISELALLADPAA